MFIFAHRVTGKYLGTSGLVTNQGKEGTELALVDEAIALANAERNFGVAKENLLTLRLTDLQEAQDINSAAPESMLALIQDGALVGVEPDSGYDPPAAPLTLDDHLAEIKELTRNNLLASEHDRRWLMQKEAAKAEGIPWLKTNPAATQAEFEAAMTAALTAEFPGEPIVVHFSGLIASYAKGAFDRGLVAVPAFEGLRDLVAATPDKQLQKLLAKL